MPTPDGSVTLKAVSLTVQEEDSAETVVAEKLGLCIPPGRSEANCGFDEFLSCKEASVMNLCSYISL